MHGQWRMDSGWILGRLLSSTQLTRFTAHIIYMHTGISLINFTLPSCQTGSPRRLPWQSPVELNQIRVTLLEVRQDALDLIYKRVVILLGTSLDFWIFK
jgi:hypothetical protein